MRYTLVALVILGACSADTEPGSSGSSTSEASTAAATGGAGASSSSSGAAGSATGGGGAGGGLGGAGGSSGGAGGAGPTNGRFCAGVPTELTGVVLAPNGVDPLPGIAVYAAKQVNPFPAQFCDPCSTPIDPYWSDTASAIDGSFTLNLDGVPYGADVTFVVRVGRFRKVTQIAVTACTSAAVPVAAATLPGNSADGEIPKIAVSTGNVDHLDDILDALGITEYDCYEGRANGLSGSCSLVPNKKIPDVLTNAPATTPLSDYHMLFLSCAPGAYTKWGSDGYDQAAMNQNVAAFVAGGGRLIATDTAYDYIEQAVPDPIEFAGPTAPAGVAQPVAGANVGCSNGATMIVSGAVADPTLAQWLLQVGIASSPSVQLQGFLQPWSVMSALSAGTTEIVGGVIDLDETKVFSNCSTQTRPLTSQFDVSMCGRAIYSSYHTLATVDPQGLTAQEKILEFLMFSVASCHF